MKSRTKIELIEGIARVPVHVDGKGPFAFFLDTGSNATVVSARLAAELGIAAEGGKEAAGAGGNFRLGNTHLARLRVGEACVEDFPASVLDLDHLAAGGDRPPDGLLGRTFLERFRVTVDYPNRALVLAWMEPEAPSGPSVPFRTAKGIVLVEARINDRGPFAFVLDTGANMTVLSASARDLLGIDAASAEEVRSAPGAFEAPLVTLDTLELGCWRHENLTACVMDFANLVAASGCAFDGILGFNVLERYAITLDYDRKRLFLDRG